MTVSPWSLLRIRNVSGKGYKTNQNSRLTFNNFFPRMVSWMHLNVMLYVHYSFCLLLRLQGVLGQNVLPLSRNVAATFMELKKCCQGIRCYVLWYNKVFASVYVFLQCASSETHSLSVCIHHITQTPLDIYFYKMLYMGTELKFVDPFQCLFFYNCVTMQDILHEHLHVFHHTYWT